MKCSIRYKYNPVNTLTEFFGRRTITGVIEATLEHVVGNRVGAAYACSDLFKRRRVLMDGWARYLAQGSGSPHQVWQGAQISAPKRRLRFGSMRPNATRPTGFVAQGGEKGVAEEGVDFRYPKSGPAEHRFLAESGQVKLGPGCPDADDPFTFSPRSRRQRTEFAANSLRAVGARQPGALSGGAGGAGGRGEPPGARRCALPGNAWGCRRGSRALALPSRPRVPAVRPPPPDRSG